MRSLRPMTRLLLIAAVLCLGAGQCLAQYGPAVNAQKNERASRVLQKKLNRVTQEEREAAAERLKAARAEVAKRSTQAGSVSTAAMGMAPGDVPDYFGVANWAFSPPLRKFVDELPLLGPGGANNLGQYIPVAVPDITTYPGSDYYEIELRQYSEQMHSDLPPTTLRGYVQVKDGADLAPIHYLGPLIVATKDRPVRIKFTNKLPTGAAGNLFIPVDTTVMGAGMGPRMVHPHMVMAMGQNVTITTMSSHGFGVGDKVTLHGFSPDAYNGCFAIRSVTATTFTIRLDSNPGGNPTTVGHVMENYTENRGTLHLHGGRTPWISDGTPHQWITPAGETTTYKEGVSVVDVPDMPAPGEGSMTFYYSNQQSARLMFYHDHSYGITRLNVYAGEAAGYMITDDAEQELISSAIIPSEQIPLIIQDKTFVDAPTVRETDPLWNWGTGLVDPATGIREPKTGDLWLSHVYMTAQNPYDASGTNPYGRWHYGPWFWPPTTNVKHGPTTNPYYDPINAPWQPPEIPGTPHPSMGMESFFDTPVVNGTAFPTLTLDPKTYRFRILNAANDRFWNLQMYVADPDVVASDGRTGTEVKMVPAVAAPGYPADWPADGREGGVPDPLTMGPSWIQIGTEGGFLPAPAVVANQPITWNLDPTTFNFGNVDLHSLLLGPAERADVIVDFSAYRGKTLLVYNDAPAAFPALDPRYDYYTGAPDLSDTGGHPGPLAGFGPNTRTVMQIKIADVEPAAAFDMARLEAAFTTTDTQDGVFKKSQDPIIVGQAAYDSAYNTTFPTTWPLWGASRIQDNKMSFQMSDGTVISDFPMEPKAIQDEMGEAFDRDYGRMSGNLGLEVPNTIAGNQNFSLYAYPTPPVELIEPTLSATPLGSPVEGVQLWKITHNGVDTHPIHFHLHDVQLVNRVGWDGAIRWPDANELGWKDTVRVSPLEDTIVALRAVIPTTPFQVPNSVRLIDPTMPEGAILYVEDQIFDPVGEPILDPSGRTDPITGLPVSIINHYINYGWEYVWHCHILSHEEMDMMHTVAVAGRPAPPSDLDAALVGGQVILNWTDNSANESEFIIQRADDLAFSTGEALFAVGANVTTYADGSAAQGKPYYYRVLARNTVGDTTQYMGDPEVVGFPNKRVDSTFSNVAMASTGVAPAPASNLVGAAAGPPAQVQLAWADNSLNEAGFRIERAVGNGAFAPLVTVGPNVTSHNDLAILQNRTYRYRVIATNSFGDAAASNTIQVVIPAAPGTPNNLRATSALGPRVNLTWGNVSNEFGYAIERAVGNGAFTEIARVGANVLNYADTNVQPTTAYRYRVRAFNVANSNYSNIAGATTPGTPPAAPTGLALTLIGVTGQAGSVRVDWVDNSNNETGFYVERRQLPSNNWTRVYTAPQNVQFFTNSGLSRGRTYVYRVRAYNSWGQSANTSAMSITIP